MQRRDAGSDLLAELARYRDARTTACLAALAALRCVVERAGCYSEKAAECETCRANRAAISTLEAALCRGARTSAQVAALRALLEWNGCECACGHHHEEHDDDCDRCFACQASAVLGMTLDELKAVRT